MGIQRALGSKDSSNPTRKTSSSARELISLVKHHGKSVKEDMDHMTMPMNKLNNHINRVEKEQSGDEPVSPSDRAYLEKIKDIRFKRMKMKEEDRNYPKSSTGMGHSADAHFNQQSKKMQDAINLHLRKGKDYPEAVKAAKVHVKEEVNLSEVLKASDPVGKWISDFIHSKDSRFNDKTKEERRKMALGAYYAAQKESYENSSEELAEGRGRPSLDHVSKPNSKGGFDIFHKKDLKKIVHQVKTKEEAKNWINNNKNTKDGEDSKPPESDKNIVNQMRKRPDGDTHHLVFANGEKKDVHVRHVNKALSMLANTPKPVDREKLQASLAHSHKRFMDTVTSGKAVVDAPRERVTLAKRVEEAVNPSTTRADRGYITATKKRKPDGSYVLVKTNKQGTKKTGDIIDAQESYDLSDEVTNSLNNLYISLSEQNKELFEERMMTEEGILDLINFARKQGF
jgi:hypothetical protein